MKLLPLDTTQFRPWPTGAVLVGGALRDALLGRPYVDLDWLVDEPEQAALRFAHETGGTPVLMDERRRHWRVALSGGALHDFAPLRAGASSVTEDLRLRDFTINALALTPGGELLDPLGGRRDLRAGLVRMASERALLDDPVRPLRAIRFGAALGFRVEQATLAAVRRAAKDQRAGNVSLPAMERAGAELAALMLTERAAQAAALLGDVGLLAVYLPELEATRGVEQGRGFHHLNVLEHSLAALDQLVAGFPHADLALRWATLLHDIGKPACKAVGPLQRVTFYGHDRLGAELAARALRRLRYGGELIRRISALVRHHMLPLPVGERAARRFVHRRRELLPDLLKLMIADREAARGPLASEANRRAYRAALGRVISIMQESPPAPPLISGSDVMELLGIPPGPRVGEALRLVAEARALGDLHDAAGARALLKRYAAAQGWVDPAG